MHFDLCGLQMRGRRVAAHFATQCLPTVMLDEHSEICSD